MPRPAWQIRSTRMRAVMSIQSRCRRTARFWWAAFSRASADRRATTSPGSMPRPAWLIRSTRTRTILTFSIAVQADGKVLAGGSFHQIGGQTRNLHCPARCHDRSRQIRPTRNANMVRVSSIAVEADGKILAGGIRTIGGQARNRIARLDATTGLAGFVRPEREQCWSIQSRCRRTARFWRAAISTGQHRRTDAQPHIARLDGTTGLADSFDPNANVLIIYSIAMAGGRQDLSGRRFLEHRWTAAHLFRSFEQRHRRAAKPVCCANPPSTRTRGGSSPQFTRVTFEYSTDNVNYTPLGNGIPQSGSSNWTLTGLNLPTSDRTSASALVVTIAALNGSGEHHGIGAECFSVAMLCRPSTLRLWMRVQTGDYVGIGGPQPSHGNRSETGAPPGHRTFVDLSIHFPMLADPVLELHGPAGFATISGDSWKTPSQAAIQATGLARPPE